MQQRKRPSRTTKEEGGLRKREFRIGRRAFLGTGASAGVAASLRGSLALGAKATRMLNMQRGAQELSVQPVLLYELPRRVPARSWRNWGGVHTAQAVKEESSRIEKELKELAAKSEFSLKLLPLATVANAQQAQALRKTPADVLAVYAAGTGTHVLNQVAASGKPLVIFLRYRSGPYYLWHEIVHARFLRSHTDSLKQTNVDFDDVVVDDIGELAWRLRALYGLRNVRGRKIVCIGGPGGWATPQAPERARERFQLEMIPVSIRDLNRMIEPARKEESLMTHAREEARAYINADGVALKTTEEAVAEAFLLKEIFLDRMKRLGAHAITVRGCMGSYAGIMPCLTLTLINDDGYMAYCEGDFVVIPAGMLLHFICGKPTYFCNPTFPSKGRMMFAHCTAPRRMNGSTLEAVELVTHYESDHGAATHVLFPKGQLLTIVKPDFEAKNWLAMTGTIVDTPFPPTCRAQVEVKLHAPTEEVVRNLRGFHCMLTYGDYTKEVAYAAKKVGVKVDVLKG